MIWLLNSERDSLSSWLRLLVMLAVQNIGFAKRWFQLFPQETHYPRPSNEMLLWRWLPSVGGRQSYLVLPCCGLKQYFVVHFCDRSLVYIDLGSSQVQLPRILKHNISMYLGYSIIACQDLPALRVRRNSSVFLSEERSGQNPWASGGPLKLVYQSHIYLNALSRLTYRATIGSTKPALQHQPHHREPGVDPAGRHGRPQWRYLPDYMPPLHLGARGVLSVREQRCLFSTAEWINGHLRHHHRPVSPRKLHLRGGGCERRVRPQPDPATVCRRQHRHQPSRWVPVTQCMYGWKATDEKVSSVHECKCWAYYWVSKAVFHIYGALVFGIVLVCFGSIF